MLRSDPGVLDLAMPILRGRGALPVRRPQLGERLHPKPLSRELHLSSAMHWRCSAQRTAPTIPWHLCHSSLHLDCEQGLADCVHPRLDREHAESLFEMGQEAALEHRTRTRTADVVVYLDYDGTVHFAAVCWHPSRGVYMCQREAPGHRLFEWAGHLETSLASFPEVALVLSTSWVSALGFSRARASLPESLARRVVGATFHSKVHGRSRASRYAFDAMPRGEQIWNDAKRRRPRRWIALDDDVEGWPEPVRSHLVACNSHLGLSDDTTRRALDEALVAAHRLR
jgi:hypothetical protein